MAIYVKEGAVRILSASFNCLRRCQHSENADLAFKCHYSVAVVSIVASLLERRDGSLVLDVTFEREGGHT